MNKFFFFLLFLSIEICGQGTGRNIKTIDLKDLFGNFEGAFCLYSFKNDSYIVYDSVQCNRRFSPCSTFKIPNSLIGLETGILSDTSFVIKYDSIHHPKNEYLLTHEPYKFWFRDLSMKQAFKYSCVWYYQELARRIGQTKMTKYVNLLNYGNRDLSGSIDNFWLCGSIEISINEQVDFLKRMYLGNLKGFSEKTVNTVKDIMLYETHANCKLYGKTGSGDCKDNKVIGWYIGFIETDSDQYVFAMNVLVNNYSDLQNNYRIEITKKILNHLKVFK